VFIHEVFDEEGLLEVEPDWRALVDRTPHASPFQTWEWCFSWWKHLGRGHLWVLLARRPDGVAGILPLCVTRYRGLPVRQLRFLGAPQADVQDAVIADEGCADAFCDHLHRRHARWDFLDLSDVALASPLVSRLCEDGFAGRVAHHRVLPYIVLPSSFDAYLTTLDKRFRKKVAYERRRLGRDFSVAFDTVGGSDVEPTMDALFALHTARWQERWTTGAFADDRIRRFHREVARRFDERGWLRLHRIVIDGQTRAVLYAFRHGARVSYYLSGFDPAYAKYGLGTLLVAHAIEHAIGEGAREFDFLRGNEAYKYQWKPIERRSVRCVLGTGDWRSRVGRMCHRVERRVERAGLALQRRLWHERL
jgi:CelD/BcsL family acetyltransferase involved in cellulose biosynthesis